MLNKENDILNIHLKRKEDEIAELKKQAENYERISVFWQSMSARLISKFDSYLKCSIGLYYFGPPITIAEAESLLFLSKEAPRLKPCFACIGTENLDIYHSMNTKKPVIKVKLKTCRDIVYSSSIMYFV